MMVFFRTKGDNRAPPPCSPQKIHQKNTQDIMHIKISIYQVGLSKVLQNLGLAICETFDKSLAGLAQDLQDLKKVYFFAVLVLAT